jgi:hypothetical protein
MAKDKEPVEILTASAEQTAEQITKQTQDYFRWLQRPCQYFLGQHKSKVPQTGDACVFSLSVFPALWRVLLR